MYSSLTMSTLCISQVCPSLILPQDYSKAIGVDVKFFKRLAENFCDNDMSKNPKKVLTSDDIKSDKYKGYKFHFEGSNSPGCKPDCQATFERIAPECTTHPIVSSTSQMLNNYHRPRGR